MNNINLIIFSNSTWTLSNFRHAPLRKIDHNFILFYTGARLDHMTQLIWFLVDSKVSLKMKIPEILGYFLYKCKMQDPVEKFEDREVMDDLKAISSWSGKGSKIPLVEGFNVCTASGQEWRLGGLRRSQSKSNDEAISIAEDCSHCHWLISICLINAIKVPKILIKLVLVLMFAGKKEAPQISN